MEAAAAVRVRFAPSPTGFLHLGGLRTALYNYLFARQRQGRFILRVEDTDQSRVVPGAAEELEGMLEWAGIAPDESPRQGGPVGPYQQSQRLGLYREATDLLLEKGAAYRCFCTPQRLELLRKEALRSQQTPRYDNRCRHLSARQVAEKVAQGAEHVVRFGLAEGVEPFCDLIHGWSRHEVASVEGDPVILKSDGFPTYHLASVVDDHLMGISHVLRGGRVARLHLQAPPAVQGLGLGPATLWPPPAADGQRRQQALQEAGPRLRGAVCAGRLLAGGPAGPHHELRLGLCSAEPHWACFAERRMGRTLKELVAEFDVGRVERHSALLELEKLSQFNRIHLARLIGDEERRQGLVADVQAAVERAFGDRLEDRGVLEKGYVEQGLGLGGACRPWESLAEGSWGGLRGRFAGSPAGRGVSPLSLTGPLWVLRLPQGHISRLQDLVSPKYAFLWIRPLVPREELRTVSAKAEEIGRQVLRLLEHQAVAWSPEELNGALQQLQAQISGTQYSSTMRLLRLALSGEQGPPSTCSLTAGWMRPVTSLCVSAWPKRCRNDGLPGPQGGGCSDPEGAVQLTGFAEERGSEHRLPGPSEGCVPVPGCCRGTQRCRSLREDLLTIG
ncbi:hypothetical protein lerEdw1_007652 [Lerista edwardsae]|nr:hypothetical protein lerEdw1_007652 [Lerista edwardsae]